MAGDFRLDYCQIVLKSCQTPHCAFDPCALRETRGNSLISTQMHLLTKVFVSYSFLIIHIEYIYNLLCDSSVHTYAKFYLYIINENRDLLLWSLVYQLFWFIIFINYNNSLRYWSSLFCNWLCGIFSHSHSKYLLDFLYYELWYLSLFSLCLCVFVWERKRGIQGIP